jgi:hypothetical protein
MNGYDPFEAISRVLDAPEKVDAGTIEILAYHLSLEREVTLFLRTLLPRADRLGDMPFALRLRVLDAAWKGEPERVEDIIAALTKFNQLRNAVVHGHDPAKIERLRAELTRAHLKLHPPDHNPTVAEIAQGICAALGRGLTSRQFGELAAKLEGLIAGMSGLVPTR